MWRREQPVWAGGNRGQGRAGQRRARAAAAATTTTTTTAMRGRRRSGRRARRQGRPPRHEAQPAATWAPDLSSWAYYLARAHGGCRRGRGRGRGRRRRACGENWAWCSAMPGMVVTSGWGGGPRGRRSGSTAGTRSSRPAGGHVREGRRDKGREANA